MSFDRKLTKLTLKVAEALPQDIGAGVARLSAENIERLGIKEDDTVILKGAGEAVAVAKAASPGTIGEDTVRLDGSLRKRANVSVGESVVVQKVKIGPAKRVVFVPLGGRVQVVLDSEDLKHALMGRVVREGEVIVIRTRQQMPDFSIFGSFFGEDFATFGEVRLGVATTDPKQIPCRIASGTRVEVDEKAKFEEKVRGLDVTYEDIGGLGEECQKIREMVELPMRHPELFERIGITAPKGVLLYGPPGTGKTLLAKAVANESNANFISIAGPEIFDKFYGESERKMREIFDEAQKKAPSIIFIDEIDAIATAREETHGEVEKRLVSQLLTLMDGLKARGDVVVIAATNRPDALDPALRRPGRFDRELEIGVPNDKGRMEILKIHTRALPLDEDVNFDQLVENTQGFVGADLAALVREAAMACIREILPRIDMKQQAIPPEVLRGIKIGKRHFDEAFKFVHPSALRDVAVEIPKVKWSDVGGLEDVKQGLIEAIEWPLKHAESFERIGITAPKGVLLYGPPGTGKTLLAKAVANESNANFISIKGPELKSKWVGESERGIRKLFRKARQVAPCILFFDEFDSIAKARGTEFDSGASENMLNQMLTEMDGIEPLNKVVVVAATNRPDLIDPSLLRPGRFERFLYVGVPDEKARLAIFKVHTAKMPLAKDVSLEKLAKETEGYVGADIEAVCREAGLGALREDMGAKEVKLAHFTEALKRVRKTLDEGMKELYEGYCERFRSKGKKNSAS